MRFVKYLLTLTALQRALEHHTPKIHHSGKSVQYAVMAYAERLIRTIKEEEVDLSDYQNYTDAYRQIGRFIDAVYNRKRIHSAFGYLTLAEFEVQWLA